MIFMIRRSLVLPALMGAVLGGWTFASCAQPVEDTGLGGHGATGGAVVGNAAGSTGGLGGSGTGGFGNAAGVGNAGGNSGGASNTGGYVNSGGNTGGYGNSGGNTGGYGNSGGSTGGYGNTGGSTGGYGNTGGSTGGYGNSGGTGGGTDCGLTASDPTCDACLQSQCYYECAACTANPDCLGLLDCINYCYGDPYCEDDCVYYYYPGGVDDLLALLGASDGCIALKCSTACQQ